MTVVDSRGEGIQDVVADALVRLEDRLSAGAVAPDDELIGAVENLIEHLEASGHDGFEYRLRLAQVVAGASGTIVPSGSVEVSNRTDVIDLRDPSPETTEPLITESPTLRRVLVAAAALACVVLGFGIYLFGITSIVMSRHQTALDGELYAWLERSGFSRQAEDGTVIPPEPRETGDPIARIISPDIGLDLVVVEGTEHAQLVAGPGRLQSSALPGHVGSTVIMGHRSTHGSPFSSIEDLDVGAVITVLSADGPLPYVVSEVAVYDDGDVDGALVDSGDASTLVLTTADPAFRASGRLVVRADLDGPPLSSRAAVQQPIDRGIERSTALGLSGDRNAWFPVLLWAHLALAVIAVLVWARRRWYPISSWLIASPVLVFCVIKLYENLARLLPSTI